jgi:hypothetical protein
MTRRPLGILGPRCACGAATEPGKRCLKCRARARWMRRKARPEQVGEVDA